MSQFLARYDPEGNERRELDIYTKLVNNEVHVLRASISASPPPKRKAQNPWPWRENYTAEGWLAFYQQNAERIDAKAAEYQRRWAKESNQTRKPLKPSSVSHQPRLSVAASPSYNGRRVPFTSVDDAHLIEWLAIENPEGKGRMSSLTYTRLTQNVSPCCIEH